MEENIIQMPDRLERLAAQISNDLSREASNRTEWVEIQIDKCAHLFAARNEFKADRDFGRWCSSNGFGDNVLSHQDRAACIAMGGDVKTLRDVLDGTSSKSIQLIHRDNSDRFTSASKPSRKKTESPAAKPSPVTDRVYDAMKTAFEAGERISDIDIANRVGGSNLTAQRARARLDAELRMRDQQTQGLSKDDRVEFRKLVEAEIRRRKKELEDDFEVRVHQEAEAWVFEHRFPSFVKAVKDANKIQAAHKGLWTKKQYFMVLKCLHSDYCKAPEADDAFRLVHMAEPVLRKPDPPERDPNRPLPRPLPTSLAEMMKLKKQVKAERAAERKRRAEARAKGSDLPTKGGL